MSKHKLSVNLITFVLKSVEFAPLLKFFDTNKKPLKKVFSEGGQKICKNLKNFLDKITLFSYNHCFCFVSAGLAQLVEHLPCKQRVGSSSLLTSSIVFNQCLTRDIWCWVSYSSGQRGQTVNLLAFAFRGSNPRLTTIAGVAQLARASAFQAEGRGFEPRFPLHLRI